MSHFTTIHTEIKDITALRAACAEMDLLLLEQAKARGYNEQERAGDYVIRLKGPYDIALNSASSGRFELTTDWWNGHVEREVGPNYGRLLQFYGVHKTLREAQRSRCTVHRETQEDGTIKLTLEEL